MKIAVITDVHANRPALRAVLASMRQERWDLIVHTGDAIGIGPFPAECLELLLETPQLICLMGNHEAWLVDGLPSPQPSWMSDGEVEHQRWTHSSIKPQLRAAVAQWPYLLEREFEGVKTAFMHYALQPSGQDFSDIIRDPAATELDRLFSSYDAELIFYGHHHPFSDVQGKARYINPGSLGCYDKAIARFAVVTFWKGHYAVEYRHIPYDDTVLFDAFEARQVPEREFIYRAFFGGRWQPGLFHKCVTVAVSGYLVATSYHPPG